MTPAHNDRLRTATVDDGPHLLRLWALLFDEDDSASDEPWRGHASTWFAQCVADPEKARFPVVDRGGQIVATAIGTLELGVPNPQCPGGRTVRLANVITLPEYRGIGYGARLVDDVIKWARSINADRVDLSTTPQGQQIYTRAGFVMTSAPRMKLVL
ncbi:MAG: GNAT family N-acetyltransferase [Terracoccus sp.]